MVVYLRGILSYPIRLQYREERYLDQLKTNYLNVTNLPENEFDLFAVLKQFEGGGGEIRYKVVPLCDTYIYNYNIDLQ